MLTRRVRCTRCHVPLPPEIYGTGEFHECTGCGAETRAEVFAALLQPPRIGTAAEGVLVENESSCFFHPAKKAAVACESCGRFLCTLCDIELGGQHLCPQCLESGKKKGRLQQLENRRTLYDSLALALATFPLIIPYFTIITAPMAIYVAIRHWKKPSSIIPRAKWRFIVALILATAQIAGWIVLFVTIFA